MRLSRALGVPLTPKSVKYFEARPYPPGVHGRARKQESDYKVRLREKQRLRAQYNIREAQLRNAFAKADKAGGKTGDVLLSDLEVDWTHWSCAPGSPAPSTRRVSSSCTGTFS